MNRKFVLTIALVLALAAAGVGVAAGGSAGGGGDDDQALTGTALERATEAALAHTGGGTVVDTETGDDGAAFGVEIRRADGSQVEVELDERFQVVGEETDDDGAGEADDDGAGETDDD